MGYSKYIYRAFTELRYAQHFAHEGRFRLGRLDSYRKIEDRARADSAEGLGHYVDRDGISEHFQFGNPIYVLCCSGKDVDLTFLRSKMGRVVVKINDRDQLAADITGYLERKGIKLFGKIRTCPVEYTKGEIIEEALDEMQRAQLSLLQKHPDFAEEREQRLYAVINEKCPKPALAPYLVIDLAQPLKYVEILPVERV